TWPWRGRRDRAGQHTRSWSCSTSPPPSSTVMTGRAVQRSFRVWDVRKTSQDGPAASVRVRHRLVNLAGMSLTAWAEEIARSLLEQTLPRRWAHVQAVAGTARGLAWMLGSNAELLTAAAVLHDVGYSPGLRDSGLHSLDGARYLRDVHHADGMVCRLVAHHSCAIAEAEQYGLAADLAREFKPAPRSLADSLIYCDMPPGPDGQRMTVEQRLADISARYGPSHPVTHALHRSAPELIAATARVTRKLSARMEMPRAIHMAPTVAC